MTKEREAVLTTRTGIGDGQRMSIDLHAHRMIVMIDTTGTTGTLLGIGGMSTVGTSEATATAMAIGVRIGIEKSAMAIVHGTNPQIVGGGTVMWTAMTGIGMKWEGTAGGTTIETGDDDR
jgi:hypothetical protein